MTYEQKLKFIERWFNDECEKFYGKGNYDLTIIHTKQENVKRVFLIDINRVSDIDFYINLDNSFQYNTKLFQKILEGENINERIFQSDEV